MFGETTISGNSLHRGMFESIYSW